MPKEKITKAVCDSATYKGDGSRRYVIWDTELRGFGLRVFPTGLRTFVVMYRPRGSRATRLMKIGVYGKMTLPQARKRATDVMLDVRDGKDPLEELRQEPTETVKDLCTRWLEDYAKTHRKSWKEDEYRIEKYIVPRLGRRQAIRVKPADVRKLHADVGKRAKTTANHVVSLIRAIYNKALRWDMLPAGHPNPAARTVDRFKEKSRERWLTGREITKLAAAINREDDVHVRAAFRLLLLTGCRKTELLRARWDRLDVPGKRLLLEDTKTGAPKVVPLSEAALDVLQDLPRSISSPWVFPSPKDGKEPLGDLKRPWERIRKRAKLPDTRIHDLRRTAGSWMVQRGVPLKVIGQALGHRDTRATEVYTRIAATQPAEALEMLGEALGRAVRPRKKRRHA